MTGIQREQKYTYHFECEWCEKLFVSARSHTKYCSKNCRKAASRFKKEVPSVLADVSEKLQYLVRHEHLIDFQSIDIPLWLVVYTLDRLQQPIKYLKSSKERWSCSECGQVQFAYPGAAIAKCDYCGKRTEWVLLND